MALLGLEGALKHYYYYYTVYSVWGPIIGPWPKDSGRIQGSNREHPATMRLTKENAPATVAQMGRFTCPATSSCCNLLETACRRWQASKETNTLALCSAP
jgi:hypothetical protein